MNWKDKRVNYKQIGPSAWAIAVLALTGCAAPIPSPHPDPVAPAAWRQVVPGSVPTEGATTLLPHQGTVAGLSQWWAGLGDSFLLELIERAQALSPSVSAAKLRMAQARFSQVQAGAAGGPLAEASLGLSRGITVIGNPVATGLIAGAQASWEIDLFGGVAANQQAARSRLEGADAAWHDARVSVAAEVANAYFGLKSCERLAYVTTQQAQSVAESARLTQLLVQAGMASASQGASALAAKSQAQSALAQVQTQCRAARTGLMALTGVTEAQLAPHTAYKAAEGLTPAVALPTVPTLPAQLLAQRPDVAAAQYEVAAASQDVGVAHAQRYPRLGLSGSVTGTRAHSYAGTDNYLTWSIGPLAISLPLLDGGQRAAASETAVARYDNATTAYQASVRKAVMEVEDALSGLQGSAEQAQMALANAQQIAVVNSAMQAKYDKGLASKIELEDVRRQALSAQATVYNLELERLKAWVALYRALGGGWQANLNSPNALKAHSGTNPTPTARAGT